MRTFMRRLRDEGRTVLVSSHVLAEVAQVADKVVIIAHGRLVRDAPGSPAVAVATVLGWSSFGEGLLSAVVPEPLLPVGAIRTAVTHGTSVLAWLSVGVLAVYAAIVMILAARVFTRKDVTV